MAAEIENTPKDDRLFDYDDVNSWAPHLNKHLSSLIPSEIYSAVRNLQPQFLDDVAAFILNHSMIDAEMFINSVSDWMQSRLVIAYHGTRLTKEEIVSIKSNGLQPLVANSRFKRISDVLSSHALNEKLSEKLPNIITALGEGNEQGDRENQVHATVSRSGLTKGYNHYLLFGSEFDQNVFDRLLGDEGYKLLHAYGKPVIIKIIVEGTEALQAANPWGVFGNIPNLIRETIYVWAYWNFDPTYDFRQLETDCGLLFTEPVTPAKIAAIIVNPLDFDDTALPDY